MAEKKNEQEKIEKKPLENRFTTMSWTRVENKSQAFDFFGVGGTLRLDLEEWNREKSVWRLEF